MQKVKFFQNYKQKIFNFDPLTLVPYKFMSAKKYAFIGTQVLDSLKTGAASTAKYPGGTNPTA